MPQGVLGSAPAVAHPGTLTCGGGGGVRVLGVWGLGFGAVYSWRVGGLSNWLF